MTTELPGFHGLQELHRSHKSLVLRGVRTHDGMKVVLKTPSDGRPGAAVVRRFARERRVTAMAQGEGVVQLVDAFVHDGSPVLVLRDIEGRSLDLWRGDATLLERTQLAREIARALEGVHARGIVHKDVNLSNVVWNPQTSAIELVDFGIATDVRHETPSREPALLEGTIATISPEQTGRMTAGVDRRSDLYSLGATLYELFAGRRLFEIADPLELVHAHLARRPTPLHEVAPAVPRALSAIVMRLVEKDPAARYQTAGGVVADLDRCCDELARGDGVSEFELGMRDRAGTIDVPRKLYGRAADVRALLGAFDRAAGGGRELVVVTGAPGIGKTSLVREVYRPIAATRGDFLEGKFDQFRLGLPYAPLGHAFGRFLRWVLTLDERALASWRERISSALGANAAVLGELLPELAMLLGPLEPVQELAVAEASNRFQLVFRRLVEAIASREHPVALFLDDLQWADLPSLRLLESLVTDADCRYLMVVAAYRDGEVDAAHPLALTLAELRRRGVSATHLELGPLGEREVQALVRETFSQRGPEIDELATLTTHKTGGNPFFLRRFLESLGERGVAVFYPSMQRWAWSLEEIESLPRTENVIALLVDRLEQLPGATLDAVAYAACIGDTFDVRLLADALERPIDAVEDDLRPAVAAELVAPYGPIDGYRWRFLHDRIHHAAYRSMEDARAERAHHRLGRLIAARHAGEADGPWQLEVVNHLDRAAGLATSPEERVELARRNLDAGRRAMRAAAFASAYDYLAAGIALLPDDAWAHHYELALGLRVEAAECAYASARFDDTAAHVAEVKAHARTLLDATQALEIELEASMARGDLKGAVVAARAALSPLGVALPLAPGMPEIGAALARATAALAGRSVDDVAALPDVSDPVVAAAQRILVRACSPAYFAEPALLPIIACELVATSVERGLSTSTPFAFAVYGIVLNSVGELAKAHEWGALAERLIERWDDRRLEARTRLVVNNNVCTWIAPLDSKLDALRDAYRIGRDTGDFEYAAIAAQAWSTNAVSSGRELSRVLEDAESFAGFMTNYGQSGILRLHRPLVQLVRNLTGGAADASRLDGPEFAEDEAVRLAQDTGSASLMFVTLSDALIARFHFGSAADAYAVAERARPFQAGAASTYHLANFHTYAPLAAAAWADAADAAERPALLARIDESLAVLEPWAAAGPANHLHRLLLVRAERARVGGELDAAATSFHAALEAVRRTPYVNDEALIGERAARYYLSRGGVFEAIGRAFLEDASFAYQRWGADAKVAALHAEFPRLLTHAQRVRAATATTTTSSGVDIDAAAVVRATRTISSEIELDRLLETVFRTIVEVAGAEKALLLLRRGGAWELAVESAAAGAPELVRRPLDELDEAAYPLSVLRYARRTGSDVVIEDAARPGSITDRDPYVRARGARSVLCLPVSRRGDVAALLYLEHDSAAGVFTAQTSAILRLLMSQALVSIHNAQLFEAQARVARAQRRFVPEQFLHSLDRHDIAEVTLGDAVERRMSVFFSDLRDFTRMVEDMQASAVIELLNDYFAAMEPHIAGAGGFIDSFNGDEIMALFDVAPEHAVRAGVDMQAALARFNATSGRSLRMGIGVNTGPVVLGTVGGRDRIKCGVVGDAVNVASRIEGLTRRYGASMLIGEATHDALPRGAFSLRPVDRVFVKGRRAGLAIFEVLDAAPAAERAAKARAQGALEDAMARYYARDFRGAAETFARCRELAPEDPVPALFVERCRALDAAPPPDDWQGFERLL